MSKMMNVAVNSSLTNEAPTRKAIARIKVANKLIEVLEDRTPRSLRELEDIICEDMMVDYINSTSVKSILEWFEQARLITTEVRKEEFITKEVMDIVMVDKDGKIIPEFIKAYDLNGNEYDVPNPEWRGETRRAYVKKQIQVSRKYYTWVA